MTLLLSQKNHEIKSLSFSIWLIDSPESLGMFFFVEFFDRRLRRCAATGILALGFLILGILAWYILALGILALSILALAILSLGVSGWNLLSISDDKILV